MAFILITGPAQIISGNPFEGEVVTEPEMLCQFHGLQTNESCLEFIELPGLEEVVTDGGHLRLLFDPEDNQLLVSTAFDITRELTNEEMNLLVTETLSQWYDGIGASSFEDGDHAVLSRTLACALHNEGQSPESLGEAANMFVEICDVEDEDDIVVSFFPEGQSSDIRIMELGAGVEDGNPMAMVALGQHYEHGEDVDVDPQRAYELYEQARQLNFPLASIYAGRCLQQGNGCNANPTQAIEYFQAAAQQGIALGYHLLGEAHEEGYGVPVNKQQAVGFYRAGAELGDPGCLAELGDCYENGRGVEVDLQRAADCYQAAFDQGFEWVQPALERVTSQLQ